MIQVNIKVIPGMGDADGKWETVDFSVFLTTHSPQLCIPVYVCKQFPPLHVLNEELQSGGRDLGMSGGCFWKPFQLDAGEYEDLKEQMLTDPKYDLEFDQELSELLSLKKWCGGVITKHGPRKRGNSI